MSRAAQLTIAIPYYSHRDFLVEAIDSVLAQTSEDWELLVVDDLGPEPAEDLVAEYDDPRIRYVRNEVNLGLAGNWNECVRLARTPWVTLLHADDRLLPEYAARVLAATEKVTADVSVIFTDASIIDESGRPTTTAADLAKRFARRLAHDHPLRGDHDLAPLLAANYIICPTMCLRRDLLGEAPFRASWRFVPDWDLTVRELLAGRQLYSVRTALLEYRRHAKQQTSLLTEDSSRFVEEFAFLDEMGARAAELGWTRSAHAAHRRISTRGHVAMYVVLDLLKGRFAAAREKSRLLADDLRAGRRRRLGADSGLGA